MPAVTKKTIKGYCIAHGRHTPAATAVGIACAHLRHTGFAGLLVLAALAPASASEYFNPALLGVGEQNATGGEIADLSAFEAGSQAAGEYHVSVYVNNDFISEQDIVFAHNEEMELLPVLTLKQYEQLGLRTDAVPGLKDVEEDGEIRDIRQYIPEARTEFVFASQRLDISIPQLLTKRRARGETDPSEWDQGLTAGLLSYALSGNQTRSKGAQGGTSDSLYASLRGGLNLGSWRLRSYGTWQQRNDAGQGRTSRFDVLSTYLQRDIHAIKGQLTLGESATSADVFDSVQFRGAQLASDDSMLPDSLRGFAPVVRGISESGAEVTVRQNNSVIYQTYVPPGPFEINDLYPASQSGDLEVTVKENDGRETTFLQPYSSIAIMQREGQLKYDLTAGELRNIGTDDDQKFYQGSLIYGLPGNATVYGGMQLSDNYLATSGGLGIGLGSMGALSADVTHAQATLAGDKKTQGQSYRLRYSRSILETGTSVSLAAYRYSTEGYYNLRDAVSYKPDSTGTADGQQHPRGEFQLTLNQSLGQIGSVYASGSKRDFWNRPGDERSWSLGYSGSAWGVTFGTNFSQSVNSHTGKEDSRMAFTLSVPLSRWLAGSDGTSRNSMQLNTSVSHTKGGDSTWQTGISGTAMEDNQLSYNLSHSDGRNSRSDNLTATWQGSKGTLSGGYNRSQTQEQFNYSIRGGVVAHPYGVTLSREPGETIALVRAPGAAGIKVNNESGLTTDSRGYAVISWVNPYRKTDISVDPQGMGHDVAMNKTSTSVTPTRGAVVLADLPTQQGHQVMMTLRQPGGKPVPFGATAQLAEGGDESTPDTGIVGDDGLLYMTGMPDQGVLELQWGKAADARCRVAFNLKTAGADNPNLPVQLQSACQRD